MSNIHTGDQHARQEVTRSNPRKSSAFVLLFGLLLLACYLVFVRPMFDGVPIRTLFEMKQLEQALESYKIDIGAYSPETGHKQIENHIHGADIRHPKLESFDASLFGSVSTLDERELLHF